MANIDENDVRNVRQGLMEFLCINTRHSARHNGPTDFEIEQIREEKFPAILDQVYFNNIITTIAKIHREIVINGSMVKLSATGLDDCGDFVANFQRDFKVNL